MVRSYILAIGILLAAAGAVHAQAGSSSSTSASSAANVELNPISGNPVAPATPSNNSSSSSTTAASSTLMNFGAVGSSTKPCAVSTGCDPLSVPTRTQGEPGSTLSGATSIGAAGPSSNSSVNPQTAVQLPGEAPSASTAELAKTAPAAPAPSVPSPSCTAQIPTTSGTLEAGTVFGGAAPGGC